MSATEIDPNEALGGRMFSGGFNTKSLTPINSILLIAKTQM